MTHSEGGVVRSLSAPVKEGIERIAVGVIKVAVVGEEEDVVEIAILSTSTRGEASVSKANETLETGLDDSDFDLPCRCGVSEGTGE